MFTLFELRAERYAYFVQSLEDRFYKHDEAERLGAALTHDLPVSFITEAGWIADTLAAAAPGRLLPPRAQRHRQGDLRAAARGAGERRRAAAGPDRGLAERLVQARARGDLRRGGDERAAPRSRS